MLPDTISPGDFIVWLDAGAYHLPWETRFSHGLCAVYGAIRRYRLSLARARETPEHGATVDRQQLSESGTALFPRQLLSVDGRCFSILTTGTAVR